MGVGCSAQISWIIESTMRPWILQLPHKLSFSQKEEIIWRQWKVSGWIKVPGQIIWSIRVWIFENKHYVIWPIQRGMTKVVSRDWLDCHQILWANEIDLTLTSKNVIMVNILYFHDNMNRIDDAMKRSHGRFSRIFSRGGGGGRFKRNFPKRFL